MMKRNTRSSEFSESCNGLIVSGAVLLTIVPIWTRRCQWTAAHGRSLTRQLARMARRRRANAMRADGCFGRRRSVATAGRVKPVTAGAPGTLSPADVQERLNEGSE